MKIKVVEEGKKRFSLIIPTRLLLNGFFASVVPVFAGRELKKYRIQLSGKSCRKFVKEFYRIRKRFGGRLDLVDMEAADGTKVKIVL